MSLLEYGAAGLSTVATEVGQCADVLDNGRAGILVPPSSVDAFAAALISLLQSETKRRTLGKYFYARVAKKFSSDTVISDICDIYDKVLGDPRRDGQDHPTERAIVASQTVI